MCVLKAVRLGKIILKRSRLLPDQNDDFCLSCKAREAVKSGSLGCDTDMP